MTNIVIRKLATWKKGTSVASDIPFMFFINEDGVIVNSDSCVGADMKETDNGGENMSVFEFAVGMHLIQLYF